MKEEPLSTFAARSVLHWFQDNARDLPWRRTTDPYAIWVSEIMLQQTQVKTVIPYWERWMHHFPTVAALAKAPEQQVLKLWEGLGYYSRARNLHKAAQMVVAEFNSQLPAEVALLRKIKGIGPYTAGAISSIAFDQPSPLVDGNVIRVLARLFSISENPKSSAGQQRFWAIAADLVSHAPALRHRYSRPCSSLNQGLMELGATICLPLNPQCDRCPLASRCTARLAGKVHDFPKLPPRPETTNRWFIACIFLANGKLLVRQRPEGVINGGLWEFPNLEINSRAAAKRTLPEFAGEGSLQPLPPFTHPITRYRITVLPYALTIDRSRRKAVAAQHQAQWMTLTEAQQLPFSSAHGKLRKIAASLFSLENP